MFVFKPVKGDAKNLAARFEMAGHKNPVVVGDHVEIPLPDEYEQVLFFDWVESMEAHFNAELVEIV